MGCASGTHPGPLKFRLMIKFCLFFIGFIADRMDSYVPVFYMSGTIVLFSSLIIKIFMCVRPRSKQSKNIEGTLKLLYEEQMVIAEKLTVL